MSDQVSWSCSDRCGHVDHYTYVVAEADRIAFTLLTGTSCSPSPPRPAGAVVATTERAAIRTPAESSPPVPASAPLVDVVSGPHTIVGLGEDCLVCEEGLEPGQVFVFCRDATRAGVAHESCTGSDHTDRATDWALRR